MTPFDRLRTELRVPYREEPYARALERAEAEVIATREAARIMLDAAIRTGSVSAVADLMDWAKEAHFAVVRLESVKARKRNTAPPPDQRTKRV